MARADQAAASTDCSASANCSNAGHGAARSQRTRSGGFWAEAGVVRGWARAHWRDYRVRAICPRRRDRDGHACDFSAYRSGCRQMLTEPVFCSKSHSTPELAWTSAAGTTDVAAGTFVSEPFTARFYQGTLTQSADPLETARYGASAIAYRPQMIIFFENLPLAAFNGKIPYVAALIGDTTAGATPSDGINLGEALERIAYSPWAGYTTETFETVGIVDVVQAVILDSDVTLVDLCKNFTRVYRNLDLLQNDMLRLVDRGALTVPDLTLTLDELIEADPPVRFSRRAPSEQPRELEFITIDPNADYTWVPAKAQRARDPIVVSGSVGKTTLTLPIVIDAATRIAMAYYTLYAEENSRKVVRFSTTSYGYELEPGDRVLLTSLGDGIDPEIFKIAETSHGANYVVECSAEAMMLCSFTVRLAVPVLRYSSAATSAASSATPH